MVIEQALLRATQQLKASAVPNPRMEANLFMQHVLGVDRLGLLRVQADALSNADYTRYMAYVARRCAKEPTAYILGEKEFMSLTFRVEPGVLIPRPDTEILCEAVLERAMEFSDSKILDLCCGSGCIGISLAHFMPTTEVTLADLSERALAIARHNAQTIAPQNTTVVCADALALDGVYDIIVSNPPYIETDVILQLQDEVRVHEPRMALDGGADGMMFYTHFAKTMQRNLRSGGMLAMEVGHTQAQAVYDLLCENGWERPEILLDLAGIERVVLAYKE